MGLKCKKELPHAVAVPKKGRISIFPLSFVFAGTGGGIPEPAPHLKWILEV